MEGVGDGGDGSGRQNSPFNLMSPTGSFPNLQNLNFNMLGASSPFSIGNTESPSFGDLGMEDHEISPKDFFENREQGLKEGSGAQKDYDAAQIAGEHAKHHHRHPVSFDNDGAQKDRPRLSKKNPRHEENPSSDCDLSEATSKHLEAHLGNQARKLPEGAGILRDPCG